MSTSITHQIYGNFKGLLVQESLFTIDNLILLVNGRRTRSLRAPWNQWETFKSIESKYRWILQNVTLKNEITWPTSWLAVYVVVQLYLLQTQGYQHGVLRGGVCPHHLMSDGVVTMHKPIENWDKQPMLWYETGDFVNHVLEYVTYGLPFIQSARSQRNLAQKWPYHRTSNQEVFRSG
jgi:hypothetical protein